MGPVTGPKAIIFRTTAYLCSKLRVVLSTFSVGTAYPQDLYSELKTR
jgi:hypothetical protein